MRPWLVLVVSSAAVAVAPGSAHAQQANACGDSYVRAQRLRADGKVLAARDELAHCKQVCSGTFRSECSEWFGEVEPRVPSIVLRVQDPAGEDLSDVRVYVDGVLVATSQEGRPLDLEVGKHQLRLEHEPYARIEREIVAIDSEARRLMVVRFERPSAGLQGRAADRPAASLPTQPGGGADVGESREARPIPWYVFALGGASLAATAFFVGFGLDGRSTMNTLDAAGCRPGCASDQVDRMRTSYLVADVSLAVGIVAGAAAVAAYLLRPTVSAPGAPAAGLPR